MRRQDKQNEEVGADTTRKDESQPPVAKATETVYHKMDLGRHFDHATISLKDGRTFRIENTLDEHGDEPLIIQANTAEFAVTTFCREVGIELQVRPNMSPLAMLVQSPDGRRTIFTDHIPEGWEAAMRLLTHEPDASDVDAPLDLRIVISSPTKTVTMVEGS